MSRAIDDSVLWRRRTLAWVALVSVVLFCVLQFWSVALPSAYLVRSPLQEKRPIVSGAVFALAMLCAGFQRYLVGVFLTCFAVGSMGIKPNEIHLDESVLRPDRLWTIWTAVVGLGLALISLWDRWFSPGEPAAIPVRQLAVLRAGTPPPGQPRERPARLITCPGCARLLPLPHWEPERPRTPSALANRSVECPNCGHRLDVPPITTRWRTPAHFGFRS